MLRGKRIEQALHVLRSEVRELSARFDKGMRMIMGKLDDVLMEIDNATTEIAANLENDAQAISDLRNQIAAQGQAPTADQLAKLDLIAARVKASAARSKEIAADPATPVPVITPATDPNATPTAG